MQLVQKLNEDPEVSLIREERIFRIPEVIISNATINGSWGIDKIEAPQAWNMNGGSRGEGVVVGVIDTGARYTHEALRSNFREDYGWFDPYTASSTPSDPVGHGTHVTGTIVGSNGIGVAPGAQWIACRNCATGGACHEFASFYCGQWIVCPTLPDGENADCSMTPHISSNSWGGEGVDTSYVDIVSAWHSAGIIPIFAVGNEGPDCETLGSPGDFDNVIGVGSTDSTDTISFFSSRGPSSEGNMKPDITAPGSAIFSAGNTADDAYAVMDGTSMATPHVSGAVALLLSRYPNLTYEEIKGNLQDNAERNLGTAETCGNTPPTQFPNNIYGYGRLNVRKTLESLSSEDNSSASSRLFAYKIGIISVIVLISAIICL